MDLSKNHFESFWSSVFKTSSGYLAIKLISNKQHSVVLCSLLCVCVERKAVEMIPVTFFSRKRSCHYPNGAGTLNVTQVSLSDFKLLWSGIRFWNVCA